MDGTEDFEIENQTLKVDKSMAYSNTKENKIVNKLIQMQVNGYGYNFGSEKEGFSGMGGQGMPLLRLSTVSDKKDKLNKELKKEGEERLKKLIELKKNFLKR